MKTITIELSVESCKQAIAELKRYQKEVRPKLDEVCKRLAEIGRDTAQAIFDSAGEGNGGVKVEIAQIENGWKIVAAGADVYFIEFGTGDDVDRHFDPVAVPVFSGSWSIEHAQKWYNYGFWYYNKVRYEGTPAYMPMYYAEKAIRDNERRIVQEVFGR